MENNKISNEQRPSVYLYDYILESDLFGWKEKWMFILLKSNADSDDKCALSIEALCKLSQFSKNTVLKTLKSLEEKGTVSIERRKGKDGGNGNMCNLYTLHEEREIWDPESKEWMDGNCQQGFRVIDHGSLKGKKLGYYEKMTFITLKKIEDSNIQCPVTTAALASLINTSEKDMRTIISGLMEKGMIAKDDRAWSDDWDESKIYKLLEDAGIWDFVAYGIDGDAGSGKEEMDDQQLIAALNAKGYIVTNKKGVVSNNLASGSGTRSSAK